MESGLARFPTPAHERAAEAVVDFAAAFPVDAVLIVNSCARGVAVPESDVDVALLVDPAVPLQLRQSIEQAWQAHYASDPLFRRLESLSRFARIHLDVFDGRWEAAVWDDGGGPDAFEIEIGNRVAHAVPLVEHTSAFAELRARWLPYYDDALRRDRLAMVRQACLLDLERVRSGAARGLPFYAFSRLYHAFQEFLQALFIARRVYPIAYDKWLEEQVSGWLGLPVLFAQLPAVLEIPRLEAGVLRARAERLAGLLETRTADPA